MIGVTTLPKFYLFVDTTDEKVIFKLKNLERVFNFDIINVDSNSYCRIFYKAEILAGDNKFYYKACINDLQDYNLETLGFNSATQLRPNFDSILSYALIKNKTFVAGTDYLALFNHFYFKDNDTIICSNNLFLVAKLVKAEISNEAVYETLFFRFPKNDNTFFKRIKCLKNFQQLSYSIKDGLEISGYVTYKELVLNSPQDIMENIESYFENINLNLTSDTFLSFSGGSDSMCTLAMLRKHGIDFKLASFPGHNDWDSNRILKISKKLKLPITFIDTKNQISNWEELEYCFITNGLSPSSHFYYFYKNLPASSNIFDGYNTLFGDWSDAFLFPPLKDSLKGHAVNEIVNQYYSGLNKEFIKKMMDYLQENYYDAFVNSNTEKGIEFAQCHSVEFIPSRVLSGVISGSAFFHNNFSFQLTRRFLSFLFYNNFGVNKTFSARVDYPGALIKQPLSIIVKDLDSAVFKLPMDHGLSFEDMYFENSLLNLKIRLNTINKIVFKYTNRRNSQKNTSLSNNLPLDFDFLVRKDCLNQYLKNGLQILQNVKAVYNNINI